VECSPLFIATTSTTEAVAASSISQHTLEIETPSERIALAGRSVSEQ
jgi:hypothetical protein